MRMSRPMLLASVIALGIGTVATPVFAQQKQPPASAIALAQQFLELKKADSFYKDSSSNLVDRVRLSLLQANLNYQHDLGEVAEKIKQDVRSRDKEIGAEMARLYATDFTEDELKALIAFYKSPVGRKYLDEEPKALQAVLAFVNDWSARFAEEIRGKFYEEMKRRGKPIM